MEPLPPVKEVEYRCYIGKLFEELSGTEHMTFAFETAKEFSSFRYEIAVRYRIQPGQLDFKVLGMTATRTMMPAFGTARSVLKIPLLPTGIYTVRMIKSDDTENIFTIEVSKKGVQILQPIPRKRFIDLVVEDSAAVSHARHLSTVSKAPPQPLVPRTIQKRIPMPGDPDYEESMNGEDADRNEDDDMFEMESAPKSGAKHVIDELEEVPMNAKSNGKAKPEPKSAHVKETHGKEIHGKEAHGKEVHAKESHSKEHSKDTHSKTSHALVKSHAPAKKAEHKPAKPAHKPASKAKPAPKKVAKPAKSKPAPKAKPAKKAAKKK